MSDDTYWRLRFSGRCPFGCSAGCFLALMAQNGSFWGQKRSVLVWNVLYAILWYCMVLPCISLYRLVYFVTLWYCMVLYCVELYCIVSYDILCYLMVSNCMLLRCWLRRAAVSRKKPIYSMELISGAQRGEKFIAGQIKQFYPGDTSTPFSIGWFQKPNLWTMLNLKFKF